MEKIDMNTCDIERLRELFSYAPETGIILNRTNRRGGAVAGGKAGCLRRDGYKEIRFDGKLWLAHRIAWALHFGEFPTERLDHRNGNRSDNRIANLRLATNAENSRNKGKYSNNASGHKGVSWSKQSGKWMAHIMTNGSRKHIGYFTDLNEAAAAYQASALELHGEFAKY